MPIAGGWEDRSKLIKISHKPLRVAYNSHFQQELLVQGTLKYIIICQWKNKSTNQGNTPPPEQEYNSAGDNPWVQQNRMKIQLFQLF